MSCLGVYVLYICVCIKPPVLIIERAELLPSMKKKRFPINAKSNFLCCLFWKSTSLVIEIFRVLCSIHVALPAGRVLLMLGKAQFELQKFVDSYVSSLFTLLKLN